MWYAQLDVSWISHVFIYDWFFPRMFDVCCCCNLTMFYDWRECVMDVFGTTKHSQCDCINTWQYTPAYKSLSDLIQCILHTNLFLTWFSAFYWVSIFCDATRLQDSSPTQHSIFNIFPGNLFLQQNRGSHLPSHFQSLNPLSVAAVKYHFLLLPKILDGTSQMTWHRPAQRECQLLSFCLLIQKQLYLL